MSDKLKNTNSSEDIRKKIGRIESRFEIFRTIIAILIALLIVLTIVIFISNKPIEAIQSLLLGPLTSLRRFANVIELMVPLTFCGLALTIVFKSNRFNLSADSAFYMGSMVACMVGIYSTLPPFITIGLAMIAGLVVGGIIGSIPAIIRFKFGAEELVISLMLNYVVGFFVKYLFNYVVRDPYEPMLQSYPLKEGVNMGLLVPRTRISWAIVIMAVVVVITYIIIYKTKWGYALRSTGENAKFARYAGIKVNNVIIGAQVIGTAVAGLGGAVEMISMHKSFKWADPPGYGFDGVIIATLARNNPAYIPLAAFFLAYVRVGADILNRTSDIPAEIVSVVQASIILLIAAKAFLGKWKEKEIIKYTELSKKVAGGEAQ